MGSKQQIRNRTIAALYFIITGILIFTTNAFSFQSPRQGRFLQRDPVGTTIAPRTTDAEQNISSASLAQSPLVLLQNPQPRVSFDINQIHEQYADGMNLYQYHRANPVKWFDPYGMKSTSQSTTNPGTQECSLEEILTGKCPNEPTAYPSGTNFNIKLNWNLASKLMMKEGICWEVELSNIEISNQLKYENKLSLGNPCKHIKSMIDPWIKYYHSLSNSVALKKGTFPDCIGCPKGQSCCKIGILDGSYTGTATVNITIPVNHVIFGSSLPWKDVGNCQVTGNLTVRGKAKGFFGKCIPDKKK